MTIYLFGNPDHPQDNLALLSASQLIKNYPQLSKVIDFRFIKPNQDLPFLNQEHVYIMDTIKGIKKITIIEDKNLNQLKLTHSSSVHDYDLSFQLKYLKKLGKIDKFTIVGLPIKKFNLSTLQKTIFKLTEKRYF